MIKATSPREIIPTPTRKALVFGHPHSLAPSPQPITLDKIATIQMTIVKETIIKFICGKTTFNPMFAKNNGDNSIYDKIPTREDT